MAQCKLSAQEYVQNAFAPLVAVLCSHDAELVCRKNNLSFVELIQPFCRLTTEAHCRDPGNISHTIHNLRISVRDFNASPPPPTLAKKLLNEAVANAQPLLDNNRSNVISVGDYDLQLSASTAWFEAYRDSFLQVSTPSDHEFTKHFLSCILVVSSAHSDPMDQFSKLTQQQHHQQHQMAHKLPKWFCPNVFRYYVLVHDVAEGEEDKAEAIYQSMKATYGVNACHLLQINSRSSLTPTEPGKSEQPMPDPWSQFLRRSDLKETGDFESGAADTEMFPSRMANHANQATLPHQDSIENATEAREESLSGTMSPVIMDHPLATSNEQLPLDDNAASPRDSQNNPIDSSSNGSQGRSGEQTKPLQHGACLTLSDHDRLRIFIHEYIVRGLIPWAERTMRTLSEQLTSRKGIHRSIFSATKKWFGGNNKPGSPAAAAEKTNVVYTMEAPEMQMRRLADLSFMFQLYEIAYQTYHTCKRDFNNDHAWLYYAGALEMAGLSVFMQGSNSQRQYPQHYMESAIATYLNTCKSPQFATRATYLSTEALKSKGMYAEAAMQFIKMTSEDADLRSALLLEQAGHCFINMKTPMVRKYSFHMILAGHRFSKAGQRKHALRAYAQALQVYKSKDWTLAEDHINFTIGRQSFNVKQLDNATAAFKHLLTQNSKQSPPQQSAFLREYLFVYKQQLNQLQLEGKAASSGLPQLPLPAVDGNATKVLLCEHKDDSVSENITPATSVTFGDDESKNATWQKLEELIVSEASVNGNGGSMLASKPTVQCFTNKTNNTVNPVGLVNEQVRVEVLLCNPLRVPLVLTDVMLLWRFLPVHYGEDVNQETLPQLITNEAESVKNKLADELIKTEVLSEVVLGSAEETPVHLSFTPHQTGELHITGIAYNLGSSSMNQSTASTPNSQGQTNNPFKANFINSIVVRGKLPLDVQGCRLNSTKEEKTSKMYAPDRRLDLVIAPPMPQLQINFTGLPSTCTMLCGEVRQVSIEFKNTGTLPLHKLYVSTTNPEFFTLGSCDYQLDKSSVYQTIPDKSGCESGEFVTMDTSKGHVQAIPIPGVLGAHRSVTLPMWVRGPTTPGVHDIDLLFYYVGVEPNPVIKHRVLRHTATVITSHSLALRGMAHRAGLDMQERQAGKPDEVVVSLQVENMNQIHDSSITEFNILQVSSASSFWHLQHLSTQKYSDIKIGVKENMLMNFKATRCLHCTQGIKEKETIFTNVTFDQHQIHSAAIPCSNFYFHSQRKQNFEDLSLEQPNPLYVPVVQPKVNAYEVVDMAVQVGLTVIVLWKAFVVDDCGQNHVVVGQHHLTIENLNTLIHSPHLVKTPVEQPPVKIIRDPDPQVAPLPSVDVTQQMLRFSLDYQETVLHNFSESSICTAVVTLKLYNCCDTSLEVHINTSDTGTEDAEEGSEPASAYSPLFDCVPTKRFLWAGAVSMQMSVEADGVRAVPLRASFCQPGVYNLGVVTVLARPLDKQGAPLITELTAQRHLAPCLITIDDSGSSQ